MDKTPIHSIILIVLINQAKLDGYNCLHSRDMYN